MISFIDYLCFMEEYLRVERVNDSRQHTSSLLTLQLAASKASGGGAIAASIRASGGYHRHSVAPLPASFDL
ncbi:hypothetical protein N7539_009434 [Penicillium diatomitis]|uniref:Uncharacterized protein n=1 Tax=Penicillium diatomitis TaxID=2819901 RepID=A0A9X0BJ34_9EURO|nr:uncharacterized protein N7539_009434 [Penicillium diatomitis]KAJ5466705.1 hypothetical protein N7539_009434 [Penicillium diatomitis]